MGEVSTTRIVRDAPARAVYGAIQGALFGLALLVIGLFFDPISGFLPTPESAGRGVVAALRMIGGFAVAGAGVRVLEPFSRVNRVFRCAVGVGTVYIALRSIPGVVDPAGGLLRDLTVFGVAAALGIGLAIEVPQLFAEQEE